MPAGLGTGNVALRNFVKEMVHKITCGSSLIKTAVVNGEVFDANSTTFGGPVVQNNITNADAFMPQSIDVGVLGITTTVDAMPNNTPGTFRVRDVTGIHNGSVVHVIDAAGNVGEALITHVHRSGSITIGSWVAAAGAPLAPGSVLIASASGSPMPAIVDTGVSSGAGATFASGQYVAALLRACEDLTVSGLGGAAITTISPIGAPHTTTVFRVGPLATQVFAIDNTMIGNTITFDDVPGTQAQLRGVSRTIVSSDAVDELTVFPALPIFPVLGDTFVLTGTQLNGFLDELNGSPAEAGRALVGGLPIGAITESANTGAPANNSNVSPVPALAYAASMRFGMLLTNNNAVEPNIMLQDQILADLRGAEMPSSFPHVPLSAAVTGAGALTTITVTLPANVGDRCTTRSGTFRLQEDITTAGAPNTQIHPALNLPGIAFTRTGNTLTFAAGQIGGGVNFLAGARVFLMTGAMNGPKKHGYADQVSSTDFLNVLAGVVRNMLDYVVPSI